MNFKNTSRRDDLLSLCYIMCFLFDSKIFRGKEEFNSMIKFKQNMTAEEIAIDPKMVDFVKYI